MPHPFSPEDFPIDEDHELNPSKVFYLKGAIHFKKTASVYELTGKVRKRFDDFSTAFMDNVTRKTQEVEKEGAKYQIGSCGDMMRTIKTMMDNNGEKICDLNITFISFDSSTVRFPKDSPHSRHEVELCPVDDAKGRKHEAFIKNSIPYFWDMTGGPIGVLYKTWNQQRIEVAKVTAYGFEKDAVLVLDGEELDEVVALATCIILLNGRDAMDS